MGPQALETFPQLLQPFSEEQFQKGVVDPSVRAYERSVLPAISQKFVDANAGESSALNQALATSAEDLTNSLAGQRIGYQQMLGNQNLGALNQLMAALGAKTNEPIVQGPQSGLLRDLIGGGGQLGASYLGGRGWL